MEYADRLILTELAIINNKVDKLMALVDDLSAALDKLTASVTSAVTEIKVEADAILAAAPQGAAVQASIDRINTLATSLDAAVAAATPPAPAPAAA